MKRIEREIPALAAYGPEGLLIRFSGIPGDHVELTQLINKKPVFSTMFDVMEKPSIGEHKLTQKQMKWIEDWRAEIMGRVGLIERDPYTGKFE